MTLEELRRAEARFEELEQKLSDPDVIVRDPSYKKYLVEHGGLARVVKSWRALRDARRELEEAQALAQSPDGEYAALAAAELPVLQEKCARELEALQAQMLASEDDGNRNVIMELRAGTGGDESAIFVGDLLRMYQHYATTRDWNFETLSFSPSERGGFKEVIVAISGTDVYACLKYESGTHRVQRVPETEAQGRIHTSAATVAVLPEVEEVEVELRAEDIRRDTYCSSGPGGQHVNTTHSAVRLTHLPSGIVVTCQDEKSQIKNTDKAMRVLRSRLYDLHRGRADAERSRERREQIGSGDRSERIRTYNFPQNRLTDHRIGFTLYNLLAVMDGELGPVIEALSKEARQRRFEGLF